MKRDRGIGAQELSIPPQNNGGLLQRELEPLMRSRPKQLRRGRNMDTNILHPLACSQGCPADRDPEGRGLYPL